MNIKIEFKEKHDKHVKNRLDKLYSDYFNVIRSNLDAHRRYGVVLKKMIMSGEIQIPQPALNKIKKLYSIKMSSEKSNLKSHA
jgi:RNase P subunit RPR2